MSTLQARNAEEGDNRISFYSAFLIPLSRGTAAVTWCPLCNIWIYFHVTAEYPVDA